MLHKIKDLIFSKKKSEDSKAETEILVKRVFPKQKFLFGKVLSFSMDSHSIQMAASYHYGRSFKIIDVRKEYFIQNSSSSLNIEDFYDQAILEFILLHKTYFTKIYLTLTGESTLYRTLLLPHLNSKELDSAVQFEIKKIIPFPLEESIYDYRTIQKFEETGNKRLKISLHATTKDNIYRQLAPFKRNNLKVDKILHAHDTIGQLLSLLNDFNENENYTIINIGKRITEISFYRGTTLEFSRSSVLSGNMLGKSTDTVKLEYFAETIANEIQNSLDFYSGQLNSASQLKILLYGDFAYSDDFIDLLNDKLEIKLERFPIDNLKLTYNKNHNVETFPVCLPVFATSVNYSILPDLLPSPLKAVRKAEQINGRLQIATAVVVLILASSWFILHTKAEHLRTKFEMLDKQSKVFIESDAYHSYKMIKQEIAFDKMYIDLAQASPSYMHLNLKELSRITPDNIKLFHLDYNPSNKDDNYYIQGIVRSSNIPPEITLAEFIENLSSSHFYQDVKIVKHVKKRDKEAFEIEFLIKMQGIV